MWYWFELISGMVLALTAWGLIRWSWRARVLPRTLFFAGAATGVIAIGVLSAASFVFPALALFAQMLFVVYLIHDVSLARLTWVRAVGLAYSLGLPLEKVLASSRTRISPFDRRRLMRALAVRQAGGEPAQVLEQLRFPVAARFVLHLQMLFPGSLGNREVRKVWQREQRVLDARQRRGAHWLYLGGIAQVAAMTIAFWQFMLGDIFDELSAEFDVAQTETTHWIDWMWRDASPFSWLLMFLLATGVVCLGIGVAQFSATWTFALWRTPRRWWIVRLLPGIQAAIENRIAISEYRHRMRGRLPPAMEKLLEAIERAEQTGGSWIDALFPGRGFERRQRELLKKAESLGNLAWAIDVVAERLTRRIVSRQALGDSVLFPILLVLVGGAAGMVPIAMFMYMTSFIQAIRG